MTTDIFVDAKAFDFETASVKETVTLRNQLSKSVGPGGVVLEGAWPALLAKVLSDKLKGDATNEDWQSALDCVGLNGQEGLDRYALRFPSENTPKAVWEALMRQRGYIINGL